MRKTDINIILLLSPFFFFSFPTLPHSILCDIGQPSLFWSQDICILLPFLS